MKLADFKLLTDENVHPEVVRFLGAEGFNVLDVKASGLVGTPDLDLIRLAHREDRVILTHDRDFGALALVANEPVVGIVYIRPGHLSPAYTLSTLRAVLRQDLNLSPPFVLVAVREGKDVRMRVRQF